jgi:hypothetical protein
LPRITEPYLIALEPKATRIMNAFALWLHNRAEFDEAKPLCQRALAIREKALGPEHPNVAQSLGKASARFSNVAFPPVIAGTT